MIMLRAAAVSVVMTCGCSFSGHPAGTVDAGDELAIDARPGAPDAAPTMAPLAMSGRQWLLPCVTDLGADNCTCGSCLTMDSFTVADQTGRTYAVTLRIRGVMEAMGFDNGVIGNDGFYTGGNPSDGGNNYYELLVSAPAQHYYVNRGGAGPNHPAWDYTTPVIQISDGATITLVSDGQDDRQWSNADAAHQPITIPGVTTTPSPYDGQFAQMDVVDCVPL